MSEEVLLSVAFAVKMNMGKRLHFRDAGHSVSTLNKRLPVRMKPADFAMLSLIACVIVLSGCEAQQQPLKVGDRAPAFTANPHGASVSAEDFRGSIIVLYFWTTSCCSEKLKPLEPFFESNRHKKLKIVAINEGNTKEAVDKFKRDTGINFYVQADEKGTIARDYGVFGYPTIFIIDGDGVIRKKILGQIETSQLEKIVKPLLDK